MIARRLSALFTLACALVLAWNVTGEVSASKITGEEERYSHIDLLDFAANVEGSKMAFSLVRQLGRIVAAAGISSPIR